MLYYKEQIFHHMKYLYIYFKLGYDKMDLSNIFTLAEITADAETPALFPYPFSFHLVFVLVAAIFFGTSFIKMKRPYQLILTIAVPFSLLIWAANSSNNRTLYYAIGIIALILIAAAFLTSILCKPKKEDSTAKENKTEE